MIRAGRVVMGPIFGGLCVASLLAGCESRPIPTVLVPDAAGARLAVERAMEFWKEGRPTGVVEATRPRIQVVDSSRKPGQTVASYRMLAESASPRERTFSLKVSLHHPDEEAVVRFLVMGADPILIFRQEDYDLMMHWEHKMDPDGDDAPSPPPVRP
ncbi:hypothetical protein [Paludisphaera mucosa]|uniref:Uncharacterized protein n=1 Tax=Paludisphaera mucosa TaxID=3030827 RepID=A0ABT6F6L2_9BACT|nr:hypothetical protein [Paludisphaera mucosa]MDG3003189.1 hypothetical protein [Paludisphaera mucosa]